MRPSDDGDTEDASYYHLGFVAPEIDLWTRKVHGNTQTWWSHKGVQGP